MPIYAEVFEELTAVQSLYGDNIELPSFYKNVAEAGCSSASDVSGNNGDCLNVYLHPKGQHGNGIAIEVYMSNDKEMEVHDSNEQGTINEAENHFVRSVGCTNFERTISGRRWLARFNVGALPPIGLSIILGENYPDGCPECTLKATWLSPSQLEAIRCRLIDIWNECPGQPILLTWLNWTEYECLAYIGADCTLTLLEDTTDGFDENCIRQAVVSLLEADLQHTRAEFNNEMHECPVCCETKRGFDFYVLDPCQHFFCKECAGAYVRMHVDQGTVQQIQDILGADEYDRWDRLILQRALDCMKDVEYCPRCNNVVVSEADFAVSKLARCTECLFSFCTDCHGTWHSGAPCESLEGKLAQLETQIGGSASSKAASSVQKRQELQNLKQELLSKMKLKMISKPCPNCGVGIQKVDGCNKVMCTLCMKCMCWVCGKAITGYDHFGEKGCRLFPGMDNGIDAWDRVPQRQPVQAYLDLQADLERNPQLRRRVKQCVQCRQPNLKRDNNNHMRCWQCNGQFCYLCLQRIVKPKDHFMPGKCHQHSAD